jgi:hypothetical protein
MARHRIDRNADDFDPALGEFRRIAGHRAELGRAHWREILRMRKQHGPTIADPVVKADNTLRGVSSEIGGGVVDAKGHGMFLNSIV